jgi:hypothetical protein
VAEEGHERRRRWDVPPYRNIMLWPGAPLAGHHGEFTSSPPHAKHGFRGTPVELSVQPLNEVDRSGLGQSTFGRHAMKFRLYPDVGGGLDLEIPAPLIPIEFPC